MVFANKCKASPLPFRYFSEIQKARADDLHELRLTVRESEVAPTHTAQRCLGLSKCWVRGEGAAAPRGSYSQQKPAGPWYGDGKSS